MLEVLKVSCHTKFRFAEREAQCILDECGPLKNSYDKIKLACTFHTSFALLFLIFLFSTLL